MYTKAKCGWVKNAQFLIVDIVCLEMAFVFAYILRFGFNIPDTFYIYESLVITIPIVHIFIVFFTEEYSSVLKRGYLKELKAVLKYDFVLLAIFLLYMFITKQSDDYSRIMIVIFLELSCVLMYSGRILLKRYLLNSYNQGKNRSLMLVLTTKNLLESTIEQLEILKYKGYRINGIAVIDEDLIDKNVQGIAIVANCESILDYVRIHSVDEIFINVSHKNEKIESLIKCIIEMGVTLHINVDWISNEIPNRLVEDIGGFTVITSSMKMATLRQLFIKRAIDICGAIVGVFATIIAYIIFAPIIYIQSPGPIIFTQERIGRNGRHFKIYKFRTMYMDAEARKNELMAQNKMNGLMFKMDNDPRITPIGRFLRRTSIDELPQSVNILKNDMSLVGTRPPTLNEFKNYELHHKQRLAAKPGLTGMWQISGRSDITNFEDVVKLDVEYITNFSLGIYMKILFKTVGVVLGRKGSA